MCIYITWATPGVNKLVQDLNDSSAGSIVYQLIILAYNCLLNVTSVYVFLYHMLSLHCSSLSKVNMILSGIKKKLFTRPKKKDV
uniref:Uncharacterized protein n=1 Tax=Pyxicephalus adspersus TaxID=30357 RepID=A0AAV2ZUN7_PYXAD|nr:TPA: hypothetical protein GDO54_017155 [Pyxicephalus adspersus]